MSESPPDPSSILDDALALEGPARSSPRPKCRTCADPEAAGIVAEFMARRALPPDDRRYIGRSIEWLRAAVLVPRGYALSQTSLKLHVRECLGLHQATGRPLYGGSE